MESLQPSEPEITREKLLELLRCIPDHQAPDNLKVVVDLDGDDPAFLFEAPDTLHVNQAAVEVIKNYQPSNVATLVLKAPPQFDTTLRSTHVRQRRQKGRNKEWWLRR